VRLGPQNARALFDMVKREGMASTRVVLHGETRSANAPAVARAPRARQPYDDELSYRQPPAHRRRPRYIDPRYEDDRDNVVTRRRTPGYASETFIRSGPPRGYWLVYPDGARVFVEGDLRLAPPPFLNSRPMR
jgi:hypothetical protein